MIEKLLNNEELFKAMMSMPVETNRSMARSRRKELFSFLWKEIGLDRQESIEQLKEMEKHFIEEFETQDVPRWLLRLEAQDTILEYMHKRFEEEGVI